MKLNFNILFTDLRENFNLRILHSNFYILPEKEVVCFSHVSDFSGLILFYKKQWKIQKK